MPIKGVIFQIVVHVNDKRVTEEDIRRTLVNMQPLKALCIEKMFWHALLKYVRPRIYTLRGSTVSINSSYLTNNITEDLYSLKSWGYTPSNWCATSRPSSSVWFPTNWNNVECYHII